MADGRAIDTLGLLANQETMVRLKEREDAKVVRQFRDDVQQPKFVDLAILDGEDVSQHQERVTAANLVDGKSWSQRMAEWLVDPANMTTEYIERRLFAEESRASIFLASPFKNARASAVEEPWVRQYRAELAKRNESAQ